MSKNNFAKIYFQIKSKLGKQIRTTHGYWHLITTIKHPSIRNKEDKIQETLRNPDYIRKSKKDPNVYLYYKFYKRLNNLYVCVINGHLNGEGYIITAYLTDRIKEGVEIWKRK